MTTRPWPLPPTDGLLIQHISDTHLGYRSWSYAEGDSMLDDIRRGLVPTPDLFVHTGDVADNGAAEEDRYSIPWLQQASRFAPTLVAMGNHDIRARVSHTRQTWEKTYRRKANTFLDVQGVRFVTFAVDDFTGLSTPWVVPAATWDWLNTVVGAASGPVVLVDHYPPQELGVSSENYLQPAAELDDLVSGHSNITGMLCGHMHLELTDPAAAAFLTIGGRSIPVLTDISSMLSLDGHSRDQSAQIQSHSAYVTIREDRWEIRYRAHGTHAWSGPDGWRVTTLDLAAGTVVRGM